MAHGADPLSRANRVAHTDRHAAGSAVHLRIPRHSYRLQFLLASKLSAALLHSRPILYALRRRLVNRSLVGDLPRPNRTRRRSRIARLRLVAVCLLGDASVALRREWSEQAAGRGLLLVECHQYEDQPLS